MHDAKDAEGLNLCCECTKGKKRHPLGASSTSFTQTARFLWSSNRAQPFLVVHHSSEAFHLRNKTAVRVSICRTSSGERRTHYSMRFQEFTSRKKFSSSLYTEYFAFCILLGRSPAPHHTVQHRSRPEQEGGNSLQRERGKGTSPSVRHPRPPHPRSKANSSVSCQAAGL